MMKTRILHLEPLLPRRSTSFCLHFLGVFDGSAYWRNLTVSDVFIVSLHFELTQITSTCISSDHILASCALAVCDYRCDPQFYVRIYAVILISRTSCPPGTTTTHNVLTGLLRGSVSISFVPPCQFLYN
jgi:hypothetical protein